MSMFTQVSLNELTAYSRLAWDYDEPAARRTRTWDDILGLEAHHTGGAGPAGDSFEARRKWLLSIERYHEGTKGWTDVFYNVFIFSDGTLWMGRDALRESQKSLHVWLTVHFPGNNPIVTQAQMQTFLKLAKKITSDPTMVRGHGERSATACPGDNVMAAVKSVRLSLSNSSEGSPTMPTILKRGSTGPAVKALQDDLNRWANSGLVSDGDFGPATEAAVTSWQTWLSVVADGVWGPASQAAHDAHIAPSTPVNTDSLPYPGSLIRRGSDNEAAVKAVQTVVGVSVDGDFGPNTKVGVKAWQTANGLTADGVVGPTTWAAMFPPRSEPLPTPEPVPAPVPVPDPVPAPEPPAPEPEPVEDTPDHVPDVDDNTSKAMNTAFTRFFKAIIQFVKDILNAGKGDGY